MEFSARKASTSCESFASLAAWHAAKSQIIVGFAIEWYGMIIRRGSFFYCLYYYYYQVYYHYHCHWNYPYYEHLDY